MGGVAECGDDDYDVGQNWVQMAEEQCNRGSIGFNTLEEGDVLAMWDRNLFTSDWPGRRVFVLLYSEQWVYVFDEHGVAIDEPDSFVVGGRQALRGDNSFEQEWGDGSDYYYCVPSVELGLLPPAVELPAVAAAESELQEEVVPMAATTAPPEPQARTEEADPAPVPADQGEDQADEGAVHQPFMTEGTRVQMWFEGRQGEARKRYSPPHPTPKPTPTPYPPPPRDMCACLCYTRYGALVGPRCGGKNVAYGFDDGELRDFTEAEIHAMVSAGTLALLNGDPREGVANDVSGCNACAGFTTIKGYPENKVVGVLLGLTGSKLFGADLYNEHHVTLERFNDRVAGGRRRSGELASTQQDRLGMHTFRQGDRVTYLGLHEDETYEDAWVFGVVYKPKSGREQARKFLILYEPTVEQFCVQTCINWRRIARVETQSDPDEPDFEQATIGEDQEDDMTRAWDASDKMSSLKKMSDAVNACSRVPPSLVEQRKSRERAAKVAASLKNRKAKAEALKAQIKEDRVKEAAAKVERKKAAALSKRKAAEAEGKGGEGNGGDEGWEVIEQKKRAELAKQRAEKACEALENRKRATREAEAAAEEAEAAAQAQDVRLGQARS